MTSTTFSEFGHDTESLEVAKKFADEIQSKTVLITGVSIKGIGFSTAKAFASQSISTLIIASRTPSKIQESIDALKAEYPSINYHALQLDLSSQKSVREAAATLLSWKGVPAIDILVNNAAITTGPERQLTEEGIELTLATNHIGHFLFTNLIMSKLLKAPKGARIVNVTSLSPTMSGIRWSDINFDKINKTLPESEQPAYAMHIACGTMHPEEKSYIPLEGYNQSKVANVLFSIAANKRLYEKYGILSIAVHPGVVQTELVRYDSPENRAAAEDMKARGLFRMKTLGAGAATTLVAATDPKLGKPESKDGHENYGAYMIDCQISDKADARAVSSAEAERLWQLSEELVKEKFEW